MEVPAVPGLLEAGRRIEVVASVRIGIWPSESREASGEVPWPKTALSLMVPRYFTLQECELGDFATVVGRLFLWNKKSREHAHKINAQHDETIQKRDTILVIA